MKKMFLRGAALLFLLCLAFANIAAQDLVVAYLDGKAEIQVGSSWTSIRIGDSVPVSTSLRLGESSFVELAFPAAAVKLSKPGTYLLADLIKDAQSVKQANVASLVAGRITKLTQKVAGDRSATVGGVRASQAAEQQKVQWAGEGDVEALLEDGLAALSEGRPAEALENFDEARDWAEAGQLAKVNFYRGYALSQQGETTAALKTFQSVKAKPEEEYFGSYVLAYAGLLIETLAPSDALNLLDQYKGSDKDMLQATFYLKGVAHKQLGNLAEAKKAFVQTRDLNPQSDTAGAATQQLAQL